MNKTTKCWLAGGVTLVLAGCVGPVEIAPLPYAHPAHPAAPAGAMPEVGSMLGAPPREPDAAAGGGKAMKGMNHSEMGSGGRTGHGGGHEG